MENDAEIKVELLNDVLCTKLIVLLKDIKPGNTMNACLAIVLGVFYEIPLISMNDNQGELDVEINYLRMYKVYLYRMMYAEVWMAYDSGNLSLDEKFEAPFLEKIENEDYSIDPNVDYSVNFLRYYYTALKYNKGENLPEDSLVKLRRIDPLYHNFWM